MTGTVKWWNDNKGYGFIDSGDGRDVFAHYTQIQGEGFKTLSEGETVEFEKISTPKGLEAHFIVRSSNTPNSKSNGFRGGGNAVYGND